MKLVYCILVASLYQCIYAKAPTARLLRTDNNVNEATKLLTLDPKSSLRLDHNPSLTKETSNAVHFGLRTKQQDYQAVQLFTEHGQAGLTATLYAEYCGDLSRCFEISFDNVVSSSRVFGM